jgi:hypothetical protein
MSNCGSTRPFQGGQARQRVQFLPLGTSLNGNACTSLLVVDQGRGMLHYIGLLQGVLVDRNRLRYWPLKGQKVKTRGSKSLVPREEDLLSFVQDLNGRLP